LEALESRDGTLEKKDADKEETRKVVAGFVGDVLRGENPDKLTSYYDGDKYIQHNTAIADGLSGLGAALAAMAEQGITMVYNKTHMVLADGDYGLACSEGTFGGVPTTYYDLFRVENGFIAEHWDVMETLADNYVVHEIHRTIVATVDDEGLPVTAAIDMTACPVGAVVRR
jgi:predicted SnoaL-like aldol condensation-catalyzing enzyme